jgi:hypothetical protein
MQILRNLMSFVTIFPQEAEMTGWLRGIWISPSEHDEIVEELRFKITQLERDYVEVAQSLIHEAEARRRAEHVRDTMQRSRTDPSRPGGNVILLGARRSR